MQTKKEDDDFVSQLKSQQFNGAEYVRFEAANGDLINVFEVRVINKSVEEIPLEPRLEGKLGSVEVVGKSIVVPKEGQTSTLILVQIPPSELDGIKSEIHLGFYNKNGEKVMDEVSEFLGPFSLAK